MTVYRTAETNTDWHNLASWCAGLITLGKRPSSSKRHRQIANHLHALPTKLIYACDDRCTLINTREYVIHSDYGRRPLRTMRADAPHTPIIVAINNRLFQLDHATPTLTTRRNERRLLKQTGASAVTKGMRPQQIAH